MEYIGFTSEDDAFWYRNNNGGWLFIATDRTEFLGRRGAYARPDALERWGLPGKTDWQRRRNQQYLSIFLLMEPLRV